MQQKPFYWKLLFFLLYFFWEEKTLRKTKDVTSTSIKRSKKGKNLRETNFIEYFTNFRQIHEFLNSFLTRKFQVSHFSTRCCMDVVLTSIGNNHMLIEKYYELFRVILFLLEYLVWPFKFRSFVPQPDQSTEGGTVRYPCNEIEIIDECTEVWRLW